MLLPHQWQRFAYGRDGGEVEQAKVDGHVRGVLDKLGRECDEGLTNVNRLLETEGYGKCEALAMSDGAKRTREQIAMIQNRWREIRALATAALV